jgi:hypothetical protein
MFLGTDRLCKYIFLFASQSIGAKDFNRKGHQEKAGKDAKASNQVGVKGVGDELENVFFMLHSGIRVNSDCVFPIVFEAI